MRNRGSMIVFEGCDLSGKSTQCKLLYENLIINNISCEQIRFPDRTTYIGQCIDSYLNNKNDLEDHAIHLLFSANRWENMIEELLLAGITVIVDRYAYSGVAFSSSKMNISIDWCKSSDTGMIKPDIIFYIDINPENTQNRLNFGIERYESLLFQNSVYNQYSKLIEPDWNIIDGNKDIQIISDEIFDRVKCYLANEKLNDKLDLLWVESNNFK
ncbi:unnamed protein product [Gordionus sp. m RMFG-2023]|uniref:thymidylate kinase-like isoform X2 n=1 Tax=Gordionus sp. m RMFG-2023 TaxID=3053472 RepID=UPI0030E4C236